MSTREALHDVRVATSMAIAWGNANLTAGGDPGQVAQRLLGMLQAIHAAAGMAIEQDIREGRTRVRARLESLRAVATGQVPGYCLTCSGQWPCATHPLSSGAPTRPYCVVCSGPCTTHPNR